MPVRTAQDATLNFDRLQKDQEKAEAKIAALETTLAVGAWTSPEGFSAKTEEHTNLQVRTERGIVRFKGFLKAKEEVAASTTVFTLPTGFRPLETVRLTAVDLNTAAVILAYVNSTGVVENHSAITIAHFWSFDGLTFNLT